MVKLLIRPAQAGDLPAMARTYRSARLVCCCWAPLPPASLSDLLDETEGETIWVAESPNHEVIGFISVTLAESFIHHLYVEPSLQRHGIGRALLAQIHGLGLPQPLTLKCLASNQTALAFYTKEGWKERSRDVADEGEFILLVFDNRAAQALPE